MSDEVLRTGPAEGPPDPVDAEVDPVLASPAVKGGAQIAVSAAAYWLGTGVTLLGSLVRGKVAAVVLGAEGLGVTSQLTTFSALVIAVAALGLGTGGVKLIAAARARQDEAEIRRLVSFLVWAPTGAGVLLALVAALAAEPLARLLLDDPDADGYLVLGALAVPFALLVTSYQLVMQAFERAFRLGVNSMITAVLTTLAAVPLTIIWGLDGAVVAIPLSAIATLAVFAIREPWVMRLAMPPRGLVREARNDLLVLAGASMAASVLALASDVVLRSAAVRVLGLEAIGLYQPVQVLSAVVLTQMAGVLSLVLLPRLSYQVEQGDSAQVLHTLTSAARASLVFVVPVLLLLMAGRDVFIVVLFDSSFLGISGVLAVQLVAEVPRFVAYALGAALLPAGLVRPWLMSSVLSTAFRVAVGLAMLPWAGLYAFAVATVVQWTVVLLFTGWVLTTRMGWQPQRRLVLLVLLGFLTVAAAAGVSIAVPWVKLLLPVVAFVWTWFLGRRDAAAILSALTGRLRRARAA